MGVSDQRHASPALLPPGKGPPVPIGQGAQLTHTDTCIEISLHTWCLGGAEVVQLVQRLATDWTLRSSFDPRRWKRGFSL
jgi:hypothetical protein